MALTHTDLIAFLKSSLNFDEAGLGPDSALFSNGALDLVAMLNLIAFVEETSGIQVRPEHVTLDNFNSPARIARYAESQL